ncbi:MAG TPA: hypothetical protein VJJ47_03035 [Candidatus Paceibacterota bacterium]
MKLKDKMGKSLERVELRRGYFLDGGNGEALCLVMPVTGRPSLHLGPVVTDDEALLRELVEALPAEIVGARVGSALFLVEASVGQAWSLHGKNGEKPEDREAEIFRSGAELRLLGEHGNLCFNTPQRK